MWRSAYPLGIVIDLNFIERSLNSIKETGAGGFLRNVREYIVSEVELLYESVVLTVAMGHIVNSFKSGSKKLEDLKALVDFGFGFSSLGFSCRPVQLRSEITALLEILDKRHVRAMLEIGTDRGGTLFLFSRISAPGAKIVSINLPWSKLNAYCMRYRNILYKSFATGGQEMCLLTGSSHEPSTLSEVRKFLSREKLDFLFIDGDHSYEGVKRDFEMYAPLVKKGGLVAFHDIAGTLENSANPVHKYWGELQERYRNKSVEIMHEDRYGIGIIYL